MSIDDLLFTIIIGGMVLSTVYMRSQYIMRRRYRIAERENELRLRELYGTRANMQDALKAPARPVSCAAALHGYPNAVLHRSLPVHVRVIYRAPVAIDGRQGMTGWTERDARRPAATGN